MYIFCRVRLYMYINSLSLIGCCAGRWDSVGAELMRLKDQNGAEYCLGPVSTGN